MIEHCKALVIIWPDGRIRVTSEREITVATVDGGFDFIRDAADQIASLRHDAPDPSDRKHFIFYPWEAVPTA